MSSRPPERSRARRIPGGAAPAIPARAYHALVPRPPAVLLRVLLVGLPLLLAPLRAVPPARAEEGVTCRHWAVLLPEDAGQHRVYDGIRKGLEVAQLERVCLKDVADEPVAFEALLAWHRGLPAPQPLLFAIGRRAAARLLAAGFSGPGVVVSTEVTAGGARLAPEPALPPGVVGVRAEVSAETLGATVRGLLGLPQDARPPVAFAYATAPAPLADPLARFAQAARLELVPLQSAAGERDGPPAPRVLLHLRLGLGETLLSFEEARSQALRLRAALLADDPARFARGGAAVIVVPDHRRLGRTAAEAGRRLWRQEPSAAGAPLVVRTTEVWVDLDAAHEQGVEPPLGFLAGVDTLRGRTGRRVEAPR